MYKRSHGAAFPRTTSMEDAEKSIRDRSIGLIGNEKLGLDRSRKRKRERQSKSKSKTECSIDVKVREKEDE